MTVYPTVRSPRVTVFGGSGFVGRHVVAALAERGFMVLNASRRPELAGHLQPLGVLGQIQSVQANVRVEWSVERAIENADAVVNLVGILAESGKQSFQAVQAEGAATIARHAAAKGARLCHVSAIGADSRSPSIYARTKAKAEDAVLEAVPEANVMRPSIVFGPEDGFFNRFAAMSRISPFLPLIGGGKTRFQPVYVRDVAEAVAVAMPVAVEVDLLRVVLAALEDGAAAAVGLHVAEDLPQRFAGRHLEHVPAAGDDAETRQLTAVADDAGATRGQLGRRACADTVDARGPGDALPALVAVQTAFAEECASVPDEGDDGRGGVGAAAAAGGQATGLGVAVGDQVGRRAAPVGQAQVAAGAGA